MTDNNMHPVADQEVEKEIVKASTINFYLQNALRCNWVMSGAVPVVAGVAFGMNGLYAVVAGEVANTLLGKSYRNAVFDDEHKKFIGKNWDAITTRWHGFHWRIDKIRKDGPITLEGQPVLLPMHSFPKDLKKN